MSAVNFPDSQDFGNGPQVGTGVLLNQLSVPLAAAAGLWVSDVFRAGSAQAVLVQFQLNPSPNNGVFGIGWGPTPSQPNLFTQENYVYNNDTNNHYDLIAPFGPYFQLSCSNAGAACTLTVSVNLLPYTIGSIFPYGDRTMSQGSVSATTGTVFQESLKWQRPGPAVLSLYGPAGPANIALLEWNSSSASYVPAGGLQTTVASQVANSQPIVVPNNSCILQLQQSSGAAHIYYYSLIAE